MTGRLLVLIGAVAAWAWAGAARAQDCALLVGWEPFGRYQFKAADGRATGLDIELTRRFAAQAGCTVTFKEEPFSRLLAEVERGTVQAVMAASDTEERRRFAAFSIAYRSETMRLLVRADDVAARRAEGLVQFLERRPKIGVIRGYYYGGEVERLRADPRYAPLFDEVTEDSFNLEKLAKRRLDGAIIDQGVARSAADGLGLGGRFSLLPAVISADEVHLMFSRRSVPAEVVARFDAAIGTVRATPDYDRLVRQFIAD